MDKELNHKPKICKCSNCDSSSMSLGGVGTTGGLQWNSEHAKGLFNKYGRYGMRAWLCLDCGLVHWQAIGNYEELRGKLSPTKE